ncbi:MAG: NUDIX hydrolase [Verrucomicrobiota bacterium]|nr:NUDIX hydrolase [Verrucomicrobiota bacterium]
MNVARAGWKTISRAIHFEDNNLSVATEVVRTPARAEARPWTIVHRKQAVAIAPTLANGELVLIRQERIPVRAALWEVPAGQIDDGNDLEMAKIEKVALRELREETGYQLAARGELLSLGIYFSSPGFTDELAHLFLARDVELSKEGHAYDEAESIVDCRSFTPREVARMITNGEIRDANTLAICARMIASGLLSFYG